MGRKRTSISIGHVTRKGDSPVVSIFFTNYVDKQTTIEGVVQLLNHYYSSKSYKPDVFPTKDGEGIINIHCEYLGQKSRTSVYVCAVQGQHQDVNGNKIGGIENLANIGIKQDIRQPVLCYTVRFEILSREAGKDTNIQGNMSKAEAGRFKDYVDLFKSMQR